MVRTELIVVPFPPSANMCYPTARNGRRIKSKRLKNWLASCNPQDVGTFDKCIIIYRMYFPDDRIRDGQSYLKPVLDWIVGEGIIKDDNRRIVKGEQWMDCGVDRENPRIEIYIKEIK